MHWGRAVDTNADRMRFERKFKTVHYEIDYLEAKVYQKTGWIFQSHIYSIEELLKSEHHSKIYAITEKIGDDAENWYKCGQLSDFERDSYYTERNIVEEKLHRVNLKIQKREPTWWESVREPFSRFVRIIMNNMPDLARTMLDNVVNRLNLPSPLRKILRLPNMSSKDAFER
jgi:hypothetical protein